MRARARVCVCVCVCVCSDANFNAFARSSSGALILCGRFPAVTCQFSNDNGYSWRAYTVDLSAGWCQGSVVEVEKDLMLWVYGAWGLNGGTKPYQLHSQLMRVVGDELVPVPYE